MYLSEQEKSWKDAIDKRIARQTKLRVVYYISDGNRVDVFTNDKGILMGLTFEQAYYVVNGICNFMEV